MMRTCSDDFKGTEKRKKIDYVDGDDDLKQKGWV
jgi:hypothetical protein